jgi:DHA1 family tetracycline resistance protein-like MFS transporter
MINVRRGSLTVIFLTVMLDLLGFGIVIPILPLYAKDMHASYLETGVLLAIYSIMQLFFAPIWGRLSDRAGRRPILLLSILGSCGSQLGYALAPSFVWLIVARGFAGLCGANITAAQAYIADVTDEKSRAAGMGIVGAAMGLGFIFGPAAGAFLSRHSATLPFFVAAALAGLNFILAFIILVEPRPAAERTHARTLTWAGLLRAATTARLASLLILFFAVTFAFSILESTIALFLADQLHYGRTQAGWIFCYVGLVMVVVQGAIIRPLSRRLGERRLIIAGTLLMSAGFAVTCAPPTLGLVMMAMTLLAAGNGLNNPSLSSLVSRAAAGEDQGGVLGVSQSLGALARVLGPLCGTWLLAMSARTPYVVGGLVMLGGCLFATAAVRQPD